MGYSDTGPNAPGEVRKVAHPGEHIILVTTDRYRLFQVAYVEPLTMSFPLIIDVVASSGAANIPPGQTLPDFNTQNFLDMEYGQLGQFRAKVHDDIDVVVLEPAQVALRNTKNVLTNINAFDARRDPQGQLTESFVFEINRLYLRVTNPSGYTITRARVAFWGFRYVLAGKLGTSLSDGVLEPLAIFNSIQEVLEHSKKNHYNYTIVPMGGWGR